MYSLNFRLVKAEQKEHLFPILPFWETGTMSLHRDISSPYSVTNALVSRKSHSPIPSVSNLKLENSAL